MKLNFPDRDLNLHMEGGHCIYKRGVDECFCRLEGVDDSHRGVLIDVENGARYEVDDVFADTIDWSWPPLGLRNVGGAAICIARTPASQYRRTIKSSNVAQQTITPQGPATIEGRGNQLFSKAAIGELFRPTYPSSIGHVKWAVNTGKAVSIALSQDLAVTAVDDDSVDDMTLFYHTIPVGVLEGTTYELMLTSGAQDSKVGKRATKLYLEWRRVNEQANTGESA